MDLGAFLGDAKAGKLDACQGCSWNPQTTEDLDFGVSCPEHSLDHRSPDSALSVHIAQDPGGASPGTTERLCFICNSDRTARHIRALWEAAVSCGPYDGKG